MFIPINENQIEQIINILSPHIFDIGNNSHKTRVLQSLIKKLSKFIFKNYNTSYYFFNKSIKCNTYYTKICRIISKI